jgi:hypothetical protein
MILKSWSFKPNSLSRKVANRSSYGQCYDFQPETEKEKEDMKALKRMIENNEVVLGKDLFYFSDDGSLCLNLYYKKS